MATPPATESHDADYNLSSTGPLSSNPPNPLAPNSESQNALEPPSTELKDTESKAIPPPKKARKKREPKPKKQSIEPLRRSSRKRFPVIRPGTSTEGELDLAIGDVWSLKDSKVNGFK